MVPIITLKADPLLKSTPGNLNALIDTPNKTVSLPNEIVAALPRTRDWLGADGQNGYYFLNMAYSFPSALAHYLNQSGLNWTPQEAKIATDHLVNDLIREGLLDASFTAPPPQRAFGARKPSGLQP